MEHPQFRIMSKEYYISVCPNVNSYVSINIVMPDNFTMGIFYYTVLNKVICNVTPQNLATH